VSLPVLARDARAQLQTELYSSGEHVVLWAASAWARGDSGVFRRSRRRGALALTNERLFLIEGPDRRAGRNGPASLVSHVWLNDISFVRTMSRPRETRVQLFSDQDLLCDVYEIGPRSILVGALYAQRRRLRGASRSL
jgi:hypothetical protein